MPSDAHLKARDLRVTCSRVTNGKAVTFVDGRSRGSRRFRDVLREMSKELGTDVADLPESSRQLLRRCASLAIECELLESRRAGGEAVDPASYAAICNAHRRAAAAFDRLKRETAAGRAPSLADYVRQYSAQPAQSLP